VKRAILKKNGSVYHLFIGLFIACLFVFSSRNATKELGHLFYFHEGMFDAIESVLMVGTSFVEVVEVLQSDIWDYFDRNREASSSVVVVAIDQDTYDKLKVPNNMPLPRSYFARLFDVLASKGARVVALDAHIEGFTSDDEQLVSAIRRVPTLIGVGRFGRSGYNDDTGRVYKSEAIFTNAAVGQGSFSILKDGDGVIRRLPPELLLEGKKYKSLGQEAAEKYLEYSRGSNGHSDNSIVTVFGNSRPLIRFYGWKGLPVIPAYRLLSEPDSLREEQLRDKLVVIGFARKVWKNDPGMDSFTIGGFYHSGLRKTLFGAEIHATIASNILRQDLIQPLSISAVFSGAVLMLFWTLKVISLDSYRGCVWAFLGLGFWTSLSLFSYLGGILLPGVASMWVLTFVRVWGSLPTFYETRRQQERLRAELERFLPPSLVDKCVKRGMTGIGVGEVLPAVVMFTDIKEFSKLLNRISPTALVPLLNQYFQAIYNVIFENEGTIMRFTGDGVVISWGAPFPVAEDAVRAIRSASSIQSVTISLEPPIETRIGVAFGEVIVGHIGANKRSDYTLLGEAVVMASRLESLNKQLGTKCLFTEEVVLRSGIIESLVYLGRFWVAGSKGGAGLYTFGDLMDDTLCEEWAVFIKAFESGKPDILGDFFSISWPETASPLFRQFFEKQLRDEKVLKIREFFCDQK
jgi:adenylate cyclase